LKEWYWNNEWANGDSGDYDNDDANDNNKVFDEMQVLPACLRINAWIKLEIIENDYGIWLWNMIMACNYIRMQWFFQDDHWSWFAKWVQLSN